MWLDNISIPRKLTLAFALTLVSIAGSSAIIINAVREQQKAFARNDIIHQQQFRSMNAAAAHLDMAQTSRGYLLTGAEEHKRLYEEAGMRFSAEMTAVLDLLEKGEPSPEAVTSLQKMQAASRQWKSEIGDQIIRLALSPLTRDEALMLVMSSRSNEYQQRFTEAQSEAFAALEEIGRKIDASVKLWEGYTLQALAFGGLAALLSALISAFLLSRNLATPLSRLTSQIGELASGKTSVQFDSMARKDGIGQIASACETLKQKLLERDRIQQEAAAQRRKADEDRERLESERRHEMEELQSSLATFAKALSDLSHGDLLSRIDHELYGPAEKLRHEYNKAVAQLRETIVVVVQTSRAVESGSREITANSDDLARRTEQQAANLEQTAASLEEITESVKQTADGAEHARKSVVSATSDAEKGGKIVGEAIAAMGNIEKSSGQISQIIGVIDEIAFQTNLLALNAGVEAARAGDAGRGFAVVASEVRALAQRSAEAAKEIKALISSSAHEVTQGVKLVHETGTALERIVKQVAEIREVVTSIAAGAAEQATGLQEINNAVGQMDQITQQNAAMVEESAASSHTLAKEAGKLTAYVARFQTGVEAAPIATPANANRRSTPSSKAVADASRRQEPARKVVNGGPARAPAPAPSSNADSWEEF